jgi:hypothetical protein
MRTAAARRNIAVETEHLKPNRKAIPDEFAVYALPALAQAAMGAARAVDVIQRQERRPRFSTAGAGRTTTAVGCEHACA